MKRIIITLTAIFLALSLCTQTAYAFQPDEAYTYDGSEAVPSTNVFQVNTIIDGTVMGCANLKSAQDIFVDSRDWIYILDSGNCRIVVLDENYHCVRELTEFNYEGTVLTLAEGAQGLFFQESTGYLYIADTKNNRVLLSDLDGSVKKVYEKPESALLDASVPYAPRKIIVDNMGLMYVTSVNVNTGALLIDSENNFLGFYGTNAIKETWEIALEYMWRSILTDEQNAQSQYSFQPTEFNNIFWSEERFVYAVSPVSDTIASPVVKLNALGNNVFPGDTTFGDLALFQELGDTAKANEMPLFSDITVDNEGVFTILDTNKGRLYQYDDSCNLLAVFGGIGAQRGLFTTPISIESDSKNQILVLDADKNTITVMNQTYYGKKIREATVLHNEGLYEEALEPWFEVVRMNANYSLAYVGIGKAYMELGEYELAKEYFKVAGDRENYSEAKEMVRSEKIRESFAGIAACVIIGMVVILGYDFFKKQILKIRKAVTAKKGEVKR
ncbi:MAG: hypothetical protein J6B85_05095 [Lachnospiraceae bacterium]|nr:hypothetical protein [Lachnospiraceae bacterium]